MAIQPIGPMPGRNKLCPCGSGLKSKWCHADPGKNAVCNRMVGELMLKLIMKEKHKRKLLSNEEYKLFCDSCKPETVQQPVTEKDVDELMAHAGLTRCASCSTPIPDGCSVCVKCKDKSDG